MPRTRNSMPIRIFPQPTLPQISVGRPSGRQPSVILITRHSRGTNRTGCNSRAPPDARNPRCGPWPQRLGLSCETGLLLAATGLKIEPAGAVRLHFGRADAVGPASFFDGHQALFYGVEHGPHLQLALSVEAGGICGFGTSVRVEKIRVRVAQARCKVAIRLLCRRDFLGILSTFLPGWASRAK